MAETCRLSFLLTAVYFLLGRGREEARAVLDGLEERFDHLGAAVVAAELFELAEPEVEPLEGGVGRVVRRAAQVAEVLHQDERAVRLAARELRVLGQLAQHARTR